ncbi:Septin-4 [Cytospora mali]|uniref:Septin-4 n=1 Tax=Cytospora mali TaxID=578113 RepID=A0A194VDB9_CYTMA|nr:Septin-4 [Valsa mali var. pyri (nom. inval.)]
MSNQNRSSIGMLLRRSKSGEMKGGRKAQQARDAELQRQRNAAVPKSPPRLPQLYNGAPAPQFDHFGGETRPDSVSIISGKTDRRQHSTPRSSMDPPRAITSTNAPAVPPIPDGPWADPYARTESMTHRGRYSYASSAVSTVNSPRRVRRRKDPTPFNILIVGTRGAGKTSFLEFLKTALALPAKKRVKSTIDAEENPNRAQPSGNFIPHFLESEIDGERVGLTLWDSEGLEKNVVDLQLREMSAFIESKFEDTFTEEMKVVRSPGVQDTHIHAVFLVLDPARLDRNISAAKVLAANGSSKYHPVGRLVGSLDEDLDLQVLRILQGKTTVIPVISKADTITAKHMTVLKKTVWDSLKKANMDPLEVLGLEDDELESTPRSSRIPEESEDSEEDSDVGGDERDAGEDLPIQGNETPRPRSSKNQDENPFIPMSIISPDLYEPEVIGRQFPWGFADPYNEEHCDFSRLKESVFGEWRGELREASREQWYEGWRTSRLKQRDGPVRRR